MKITEIVTINLKEYATAGAQVLVVLPSGETPHVAIGPDRFKNHTQELASQVQKHPRVSKAVKQTPKDNALDMKGTSIFGQPKKGKYTYEAQRIKRRFSRFGPKSRARPEVKMVNQIYTKRQNIQSNCTNY